MASTELSNGCANNMHVMCGVSGEAFANRPAWLCGCVCHLDGTYATARARVDARLRTAGITSFVA